MQLSSEHAAYDSLLCTVGSVTRGYVSGGGNVGSLGGGVRGFGVSWERLTGAGEQRALERARAIEGVAWQGSAVTYLPSHSSGGSYLQTHVERYDSIGEQTLSDKKCFRASRQLLNIRS